MPAAPKILPFVRPSEPQELDESQRQALARGMPLAVAEQRMQEAWWAFEAASARQVKPHELQLLEDAYAQALTAYEGLQPCSLGATNCAAIAREEHPCYHERPD